MEVISTPDVQRLLHRCYTLYTAGRKPEGALLNLINEAIVLGSEVMNLSGVSQDVLDRYIEVLTKVEQLLLKGGSSGSFGIFKLKKSDSELINGLKGCLEDIRGDVHSLMNVMRNSHHDSWLTVSLLISRLGKGNEERRESAVRKLAMMAWVDKASQEIADMGGIPMLISMLDEASTECQIQALHVLSNMALMDRENQESIVYHGGLERIAKLLSLSSGDVQKQATRCLGNMSTTLPTHLTEQWSQILVSVMKLLQNSSACRLQAVRAMVIFSRHQPFREKVIKQGTVKPLLRVVKESCELTRHAAVLALTHLAGVKSGSIALVKEGGVQQFFKVIQRYSVTSKCKDNVMYCLASMSGLEESLEMNSSAWKRGLTPLLDDWRYQTPAFKRNSLLVMTNMSSKLSLQESMVAAGVVSIVVVALSSNDKACIQRSSLVLANLASNPKCGDTVYSQIIAAQGVAPLVEILHSEDDLCWEQACRTLSYMAQVMELRQHLISAGIVEVLLAVLRLTVISDPCVGYVGSILHALSKEPDGLLEIYQCFGEGVIENFTGEGVFCREKFLVLLERLKEVEANGG